MNVVDGEHFDLLEVRENCRRRGGQSHIHRAPPRSGRGAARRLQQVALAGALRAPEPHGIGVAARETADVLDRGSVAARYERLEARVILEHERER